MRIIATKDKITGAAKAFEILSREIKAGAKVLGLATGSPPIELYQNMVNNDLNFSNLTSINLDEYVGLSPQNKQSYQYFMNERLFKVKPFEHSYLPDGQTNDIAIEAEHYNQIIKESPVDIQLLGIGRSGHIAFNEPGAPFDGTIHEVKLTQSTTEANAHFLDNTDNVPKSAICMGTASIMSTKKIALLAYGEKKRWITKNMIEGPITEEMPASIFQKHPDVTIIRDEAAAQDLDKKYLA